MVRSTPQDHLVRTAKLLWGLMELRVFVRPRGLEPVINTHIIFPPNKDHYTKANTSMYFVQTFEGQNSEVGPKSTPLNMFSDIIVYVHRRPQLQLTNCNKPRLLCFTPQQPELQILQPIIPKTNSSLVIEWGTYTRHFSCTSP